MTQIINDGTGTIDRIIGAPIRFVQDKANQVGNLFDTYKQNQSLKTQVADLSSSKNNQESLEVENKELKEALKLQETLIAAVNKASKTVNSSWLMGVLLGV